MRVALFMMMCALAAAANTKVTVREGPKECEATEKVQKGNWLSMHYTGTIDESSKTGKKGSKFDSSRDRDETFDFAVGEGQVITGWDEVLIGLCKGAKATLVIPPEEGYGEDGAGDDIPGGATLNFDVEVVDVKDEVPEGAGMDGEEDQTALLQKQFDEIDGDKDGKLTKDEVEAHFKKEDGPEAEIPEGFWEEGPDKDKDGIITWEEFAEAAEGQDGPEGEEGEEAVEGEEPGEGDELPPEGEDEAPEGEDEEVPDPPTEDL